MSAQTGLNGKFFVPRLLHRDGRLAAMIVPFWYDRKQIAYRVLQKAYWNLPNFYHLELDGAKIYSMLVKRVWFELSRYHRRKSCGAWEFVDLCNRSYQRDLLSICKSSSFRSLREGPPGIFISWSDISLEAIRFFHSIGWKTVTMQLNCGSLEESLIETECQRYPNMQEKSYLAVPGFHERTLQEYRETDHIISNSGWGFDFLLSQGIPKGKTSLIPFAFEGTSERKFQRVYPESFDSGRPLRILHIGQMSLRKGIGRFFEAIERMRDLPVEFTFAGSISVPITPEISSNDKVRILGVVSLEKINELYRDSDVFLFPTLSDAFGLTQLECMAWKLPLVASRHCGDVVLPGVNGLRLETVTAESIVAAVRHFLEHPADLPRFSSGCRIPPECTLDHFHESLIQIESLLYPASTNSNNRSQST